MDPQSKPASGKKDWSVSLRTYNYIMVGASLIIALFMLITVQQLYTGYTALRDATDDYESLEMSANDLQASSDYLTEQVRNFTMTGDRTYLDGYFYEATVTRRREKALEQLREKPYAAEAYKSLEKAMEASVELMDTEYYAMRLTVEAYGYNISDFPEAVQNAELPENMSRAALADLARKLVTDDYYRAQKSVISDNMKQCMTELLREMDSNRRQTENELSRCIFRLGMLVATQISVILLRILLSSSLVISPLMSGVECIIDGNEAPVSGVNEIRFLFKTYNKIFRETQARTDRLSFEVNHDKLTGVYNRAGYDYLMEHLDLSSCALLIVDVDKFKDVNDTFGHSMGDQALERVASAFLESFRADDHICRIGGDEFAVVMERTGPASRGQIEKKIEQINESLKKERPPLSISVGCAFGADGGDIGKNADAALYYVKEHGRSGCAFYK